jgi:tetratricopeptide (TPR) repeat protein
VIRFVKLLTIFAIAAYSSAGLCRAQGNSAFDPKDPMILIETAWALLSQNDNVQAILIADQAIAEAPHSPFAFHVRGKAFHANAEFEKAAENLLTAYRLYNFRAKLYFNRYEAHSRTGEHLAADADFRTYTTLAHSALAALDDLEKADTRLPARASGDQYERGRTAASTPPAPLQHARPAPMVTR